MSYNYKVYPADPSIYNNITGKGEIPAFILFPQVIAIIIGFVYFFINLFSGGYTWLYCLGIVIVGIVLGQYFVNEGDKKYRIQKVKDEAESLSKQLNGLLNKSEEIVKNILPSFETAAQKSIELAKIFGKCSFSILESNRKCQ